MNPFACEEDSFFTLLDDDNEELIFDNNFSLRDEKNSSNPTEFLLDDDDDEDLLIDSLMSMSNMDSSLESSSSSSFVANPADMVRSYDTNAVSSDVTSGTLNPKSSVINPKEKKIQESIININLKKENINPDDPFAIASDLASDYRVGSLFTSSAKFHGDRNAVFLIIVDCPFSEDNGQVDPKKSIYKAFKKNIQNFYENIFLYQKDVKDKDGNSLLDTQKRNDPAHYSIALVSLAMGGHSDKYRHFPNAPEVAASAPHLKQLILNMPNLRFIYVMGTYAEELFWHNFDPNQMYLRDYGSKFSIHDIPSYTMVKRRSDGRFLNTYLGGEKSMRFMKMPWITSKKFPLLIKDSLFRLEDTVFPLIRFPVSNIPFSIADAPLRLPLNGKNYFNFETFKAYIYADLRTLYSTRRRKTPSQRALSQLFDDDNDDNTRLSLFSPLRNSSSNAFPFSSSSFDTSPTSSNDSMTNTYDRIIDEQDFIKKHPTALFRDVSLDPILQRSPFQENYACVRQLKYDPVTNHINIFGQTLAGNPIMVTVRGATFTFFIKPHPKFAGPDVQWPEHEKDLKDIHIDYLRSIVCKKMYYIFKSRQDTYSEKKETNITHVSFELTNGYYDYKEGYWHQREFVFIKVVVRHHAYIDPLLNNIKRIICPDKKNVGKKDKLCIYKVYSPEHMFIYEYNILMSNWIRFENLKILTPYGIDDSQGVHHSRCLYGVVDLNDPKSSIQTVDKENPEKLGGSNLTGSDFPTDLRAAFDIETFYQKESASAEEGGIRTHDNTPIICICIAVRVHDHKVSMFDRDASNKRKPTFLPESGYIYFTFMLGDVKPQDSTDELNGHEFLFEFSCEREMLTAYYYFRRWLFATYIIFHNGKRFDDPKLFTRATMLGIKVPPLGYRDDQISRIVHSTFQSRAYGESTQTCFEGHEGIIYIDTLLVAFRELKRRSYKLGPLSKEFAGGMTKADMPYDAIKGHWRESSESRRTLVNYCIRDAQLPDQITTSRQTVAIMNSLARVTGNIPEDKIYEEGMQVKVLGAIMQTIYLKKAKVLIPSNKHWMNVNNDLMLSEHDTNKVMDQIRDEVSSTYFPDDKENDPLNPENTIATVEKEEAPISNKTRNFAQEVTLPVRSTRDFFKPTSLESSFSSNAELFASYKPRQDNPRIKKPDIFTILKRKQLAKEAKDKEAAEKAKKRLDSGKKPLVKRPRKRKPEKRNLAKNAPSIYEVNANADTVFNRQTLSEDRSQSSIDSFFSSSSTKFAPPPAVSESSAKPARRTYKRERDEVEKDLAKINAESNTLSRDAEYSGAIVIKTNSGWIRDNMLVCLDFQALYPSEIQANNIGSDTKILEDEMALRGVTMDMVYDPPDGLYVTNPRTKRKGRVFYIKPEYRRSIIAETEDMVIAQRLKAKKDITRYGALKIENAEGVLIPNPEYNKNISENVEKKSDSLKLIANSMYGVTGTEGNLGDRHCAASVTAYARFHLMLTKRMVETLFRAKTRGGDTDSGFFEFCDPEGIYVFDTIEEISEFCKKVLLPQINAQFRYPIKLDFEKVMINYIPVAAKRYIFWFMMLGMAAKLSYKGLETVRRDSLPFTKETMERVFNTLMKLHPDVLPGEAKIKEKFAAELANTQDPTEIETLNKNMKIELRENRRAFDKTWVVQQVKEAVDYIRQRGRELLTGQVSIGELVLSKAISREYYTNVNQEHLTVVRKLTERNMAAPTTGDRVNFVYTIMPKSATSNEKRRNFELADDPEWVVRNDIPVNYPLYFEKKFIKPVTAVMRFFLMEDMVRSVYKKTGKTNISLKDITEETELFLFGVNRKEKLMYGHDQLRFGQMTNFKVVTAKGDINKKNSIARYVSSFDPSFKNYIDRHGLNGQEKEGLVRLKKEYDQKISLMKETEKNQKEEIEKIHEGCRSCLKLKTKTSNIPCATIDCDIFFPRITLEGKTEKNSKEIIKAKLELSKLICNAVEEFPDIEDLCL